jgi:hypothetical protein
MAATAALVLLLSAAATTTASAQCVVAYPRWIGDGYCDDNSDGAYNTAACAFDGGDCCEASCLLLASAHRAYECGVAGYECRDPAYQITTTTTIAGCDVERPSWVGDGYCDEGSNGGDYNSAECAFDGGDVSLVCGGGGVGACVCRCVLVLVLVLMCV